MHWNPHLLISMNALHIYPDLGKAHIAPEIYGHFAEHLGRCIYEGLWVGEESSIVNKNGIRTDVVEALKRLDIPVLRWPGGCFADEYHWKDGIGPRERRKNIVNTHWGNVTENNHFGTHEFFELCAMLGTKPYVCGNVGSGTVQEMADWVEYMTLDATSPMADLRREHGNENGWELPYFGVGNENWGCGGNMRPEYYADEYRRYVTYVRNHSGRKPYKIACGANAEDYKWTEVLMERAGGHMDGLSLHYYTIANNWTKKGSSTEFDEDQYFRTLRAALKIDTVVARHSAIMDVYDPHKRVGMIVDEWGTWWDVEPGTNPGFLYQQNTMRDALVAALSLNVFNTHAARVRMANIAQTINVLQAMILTDKEKMLLTPTFHVFEMMKGHQGATLLESRLVAADYEFGGGSLASIHASASKASDGSVLTSVCHFNPNQETTLEVHLHDGDAANVTGRLLTADSLQAHNTFEAPETIAATDFTNFKVEKLASGSKLVVTLPPMSVVTLHLS
jgi:alpha-L-arabinofuranosidase